MFHFYISGQNGELPTGLSSSFNDQTPDATETVVCARQSLVPLVTDSEDSETPDMLFEKAQKKYREALPGEHPDALDLYPVCCECSQNGLVEEVFPPLDYNCVNKTSRIEHLKKIAWAVEIDFSRKSGRKRKKWNTWKDPSTPCFDDKFSWKNLLKDPE